ncbi:MAG: hypothetical protein Q4G70_02295 [Pseudomonadota bacterium]|nr:hypothetical protein [Pseudomonadota bacterium]
MVNGAVSAAAKEVDRFELMLMHVFRIEGAGETVDERMAAVRDTLKLSGWRECEPVKRPQQSELAQPSVEQLHRYQEAMYFHPFVQRLLYGGQDLYLFKRENVQALTVRYREWNGELWEAGLLVRDCELAVCAPDAVVLTLYLAWPDEAKRPTVKQVQRLLDTLRRAYPPYFTPDGSEPLTKFSPGHCLHQVSLNWTSAVDPMDEHHARNEPTAGTTNFESCQDFWLGWPDADDAGESFPLAAHLRELLKPLRCEPMHIGDQADSLRLVQLGDDRAFTLAYVAINEVRDFVTRSRGDFIRLGCLDDPGANLLPYAADFLRDFEANHCYDCFWYAGKELDSGYYPSRIVQTPYSMLYLGDNRDEDFFVDERAGALAHFRGAYRRMCLVAVAQRALLLNTAWHLAQLDTEREKPDHLARLQRFYGDFLRFTQRAWFFEVSPQMQGQELFLRQQTHLKTRELYEEVRQEWKDVLEVAQLEQTARFNRQASVLTQVAAILGFGSLIVGVLGANFLEIQGNKSQVVFGVPLKVELMWRGVELGGLMISLVLLLGFGCLAYWGWRRIKKGLESATTHSVTGLARGRV